MIREILKRQIRSVIYKKFGKVEIPAFTVSVSENAEYGDYATNAAFVLAKLLNKPPMEIAQELASGVENQELWKTTIAAPGFINFHLSQRTLEKEFSKILIMGKNYGKEKRNKRKIQLEFVSANPTGPLTLANGRGGFLGSTLANVFLFNGYAVEREYYVNDTGNQILTLGKSLLAVSGVIADEGDFYKGEYIKEWMSANPAIVKRYRNRPLELGRRAARDFLKSIKKAIKRGGIIFDRFTSEDTLHKKGFVKKALHLFETKNKVYRKDGAVWLKTTEYGDDKDRVLITQDGFPTYFLADAGHYFETKERGFDTKINVFGPDHYGYVARIQAAATLIGIKKSVAIVTQAIRITSKGKEVRMSKRKGKFITLEELTSEVPVDVVRFFFLEKSPDTHIDFDLDLAKERSMKNPVYYIQYAFVRCRGILQKTQSTKSKAQIKHKTQNTRLLNATEETNLVKKLIQFPEVVGDTAKDYQVHRLPRYAYELAHSFHNFYEKHRVITKDIELTRVRIELVRAVRIVLGNTLALMGISAPEKM